MGYLRSLYRAIEQSTGKPVEYLQKTPLDELRREAEESLGRPIRFGSNMLQILSREEIERQMDESFSR